MLSPKRLFYFLKLALSSPYMGRLALPVLAGSAAACRPAAPAPDDKKLQSGLFLYP
jgi:hypothetical protein